MNRAAAISGMIVFLLLGLGFGSLFLPRTVNHTATQFDTTTTTVTAVVNSTMTGPLPTVTATAQTLLVIGVAATCTTVSGTISIVYAEIYPGESTSVTTDYPQHLPQEYQVTLVTNSTVSAVTKTYVSVPDTC